MEPMQVSNEQLEFFRDNGYVVLDPIAGQEELETLRRIYDELFARRAGREQGAQFDLAGADEEDAEATLPQILGPARFAPELNDMEFKKMGASCARQLLGGEVEGGDHAILKPPFIGSDTPWHQDEAYWNPSLIYSSLSIWMPLQDATVESGCMQFVPGSHRRGVLPHHPINNDPRVHGLEVDDFNQEAVVACPIPAGAVTVHHCRTLHYAGPNLTAEPRRAYIQTFGLRTQTRDEPRNFYWQRIQQTARQSRADEFERKSADG
jgi:ectoine hydroxylase-related dioxygenase (phytanoyl-CoA dioxygenase family)